MEKEGRVLTKYSYKSYSEVYCRYNNMVTTLISYTTKDTVQSITSESIENISLTKIFDKETGILT